MDPGLLTRARDGDREAFELIVVSRGEALFRTALAILGHEADAFDATQEALIASWRGLSNAARSGAIRRVARTDPRQ